MTIYELSISYQQTAADLRHRIVELERAGRESGDERVQLQMEGRARSLRSMYRDVRAAARHLEHYYEKYTPGHAAKNGAAKRKGRA